jgi:hypothetical protein
MKKIYLIIATALLAGAATAQNELYNNGGLIHINANCIVQVNGAVINKATSTITNNGTLNVTGNVTNDATLIFNAGVFAFKGTTPQILNGTTAYNAKNVLVDNVAGVTLNSKLVADGAVTFTKGIVKASATTAPFVFTTNATVTGAKDSSHVNGYVVKEGTGAFTYPVGDSIKYQPCGVNLTANATGMQVKYDTTNAGAASFGTTGADPTPLIAYNALEHWDISPLSTATGTVTMHWDGYKNGGILNVSDLKVAHKTGGSWLNEGGTGTGTISAGSVTSSAISTWSPFTLGSIVNSTLPLQWLNINGNLNSQKQAVVNWKVQENNVTSYQIEKSNDGRTFANIATVTSKGNGENTYQFTDATALDGIKYYRIKQIDANGSYSYSTIVRLSNNIKSNISIYPNPVKDVVTVSGAVAGSKVILTDISGKVLQQINVTATSFTIDMSKYSGGIYMLQTNSGVTQKIIKE